MADTRWLDAREAVAWRGLVQMHAQLTAELGRRLATSSGLSDQDYAVLVELTESREGRLRMFELAEQLGWEKSRLSHHVARMADRGLIRKVRCASDRRGLYVVVTAKGRREIEAAAPSHVEAVRELFVDQLSPDQLDVIAQAADRVLAKLNHGGGRIRS